MKALYNLKESRTLWYVGISLECLWCLWSILVLREGKWITVYIFIEKKLYDLLIHVDDLLICCKNQKERNNIFSYWKSKECLGPTVLGG